MTSQISPHKILTGEVYDKFFGGKILMSGLNSVDTELMRKAWYYAHAVTSVILSG